MEPYSQNQSRGAKGDFPEPAVRADDVHVSGGSIGDSTHVPESRVLALGLTFAFAFLTLLLWFLTAWALAPLVADQHPLIESVFSLLLAVALSTYFLLRVSGYRGWESIGLPASAVGIRHWAAGATGGVVLAAVIVGIQWSAGWLNVARPPAAGHAGEWLWEPPLLVGVFVLAVGAAGEELLFRGLGLQQLMRAATPWPAVIGTSALFGVLHANNPDFSRIGMLNTMLFGGLFGMALVRHRSLWLPYGLHFGWNLTLALAGVNVSGLTIRLTDLSFAPAGPSLWSGAEYGPEGSLLTTFAVAALGVGLWKVRLEADPSPKLWETIPAVSREGGQS